MAAPRVCAARPSGAQAYLNQAIAKVFFPAVLFVGILTIDLQSTNTTVLATVLLAKLANLLLACLLG